MEKSPVSPGSEEKKDPDPKDGNWVAGMPLLMDTCSKLRSGELVIQDGFTLHEAMSAVELGDPKMDSGLAWHGIYMPEEKLEMRTLKPISELSLQDVAAITTMLLRLEATYYDGHSLPQTVWTCAYVGLVQNRLVATDSATQEHLKQLQPPPPVLTIAPVAPTSPNPSVAERVLELFVRLQLRALSVVIDAVRHGDCNEEEDFATFHFHLPVDYPVDAAKADEGLLRAAAELADSLAAAADDSASVILAELLRFRRVWLQLHLGLARAPTGIDQTRRFMAQTHERLAALRAITARLGDWPLPDNCMEPLIVKRLSVPVAPRPISVFSWPDALQKLCLLSAHLTRVLEVPLQGPSCTLRNLREFFVHFASLGADAIPRARMHLMWQAGQPPKKVFGNVSLPDLVREDMLAAGLPKGVLDSAKADFCEKGAVVMVHLFRALCFNPARRHRKLAHVFWELEVLQTIADQLDADITGYGEDMVLGAWVTSWTVAQMYLMLEMGFSLQLHAPHEYAQLFFYRENLHRFGAVMLEHLAKASLLSKRTLKKKDAIGKKMAEQAPPPAPVPHALDHIQLNLSGALSYIMQAHQAIAQTTGRSATNLVVGTAELRWTQRFQVFARVHSPPMISYNFWQQKEKKMTEGRAPIDMLRDAAELLQHAKTACERLGKLLDEQEKEKPKEPVSAASGKQPPAAGDPRAPAIALSHPPTIREQHKAFLRIVVMNSLNVAKKITALSAATPPAPEQLQCDFSLHTMFPIVTKF